MINVSRLRSLSSFSRIDDPCIKALGRVFTTLMSSVATSIRSDRLWPWLPIAVSEITRSRHSFGAKCSYIRCVQSAGKVDWVQATMPPAARVARASRLILSTIERDSGISTADKSGSTQAFCISITTKAERSGSMLLKTCVCPRRAIQESITFSGIMVLCIKYVYTALEFHNKPA